jgi:subfamily B ATP-binding cassette protein MsbA
MFAGYWRAIPGLLALGLFASIAESIGIGLIVVLLDALLTDSASPISAGGFLGRLSSFVAGVLGPSPAIIALLVILFIVARALCNFAYVMMSSRLRHDISHEVRARIHAQFLDLPFDLVQQRRSGELFNILQSDSWSVADCCQVLLRVATNALTILVFAGFMLAISPKLAAVALTGSAAILFLMNLFGRSAERLGEASVAAGAALHDRILADMQGMRTIRAFAGEDRHKDEFRDVSARARHVFVAIDRLYAAIQPINEIAALALLGVIIALAKPLGISASAAIAGVLIMYRMQPQLRELKDNRLTLLSHRASLLLVREILGMDDAQRLPAGTVPFEHLHDGIVLDELCFRYRGQDRDVFESLSAQIPARGLVTIAGHSGSGKTTLVNLLLRLYRPTRGRILVDGCPLDDIERKSWLSHIALSGQDADLISGTIAANINLPKPNALRRELRDIARLAGIDEFIDELPQGYDTPVGDRGINLSGGQRQRIGLARALLRDPDILILDEATNAIEDDLERRILLRLRERFADRLILHITHRTTNLLAADAVIRLGDVSPEVAGERLAG